ncbi:MAG: aminotransferase class V-fold PLP-dependent enzyme, partial [Dehalococcoidia bacterium]
MKRSIYLDHAATTPLHPEVLEAMLPYLSGHFGNPSGAYALGRQAARAVNEARSSVAEVLGCRTREVVFTGAGTESINLAIKGVAFAQQLAAHLAAEDRPRALYQGLTAVAMECHGQAPRFELRPL